MNFKNRPEVGTMLADKLHQFRSQDAIVVCLQENSLLTCLTLASQLRAWVYPLVYETVAAPNDPQQIVGAFDQDGTFYSNPGSSGEQPTETDKAAAMDVIKKRIASYDMPLDKHIMVERDVILAGDVVTSPLPLLIAQQLVFSVRPKSITAAVGNVTPDVALLFHQSAMKADILDILHGIVLEDDRYFEQTDAYTLEQKYNLTRNIATYWE